LNFKNLQLPKEAIKKGVVIKTLPGYKDNIISPIVAKAFDWLKNTIYNYSTE
jgi:hypothetical protein